MPLLPPDPLFRLFANLSSRGSEPRQEGAALLYPLRPGFRIFFLCAFLFGLYILAVNVPLLLHHQEGTHWTSFLFGIFMGFAGLLSFTPPARLDEDGLHHRLILRTTHLPWSQLHHVERQHSGTSNRSTWFFRNGRSGADGRTIVLNEMAYNVPHLLDQIRRRIPLPEQPYHRRHWYGG